VLLVLLIIFMVIAPSKPARFETKIPDKPKPDVQDAPPGETIVVDVKTGSGLDQMVELNRNAMPLPQLEVYLKSLFETRPDRTVFIKARKDKPYGDIVAVIDVVKGAGGSPIGLQIDYLE
jgi:biopolymer transport protein ExbD